MRINKAVAGYAVGVVTTLVAVAAGQAIGAAHDTAFDTITVHRINVVEPDGTLRMTISDRAEFPGIIVKGKQFPHASRDDVAGMIFFNDEGTENGGLIFNGKKEDGRVVSSGHLSFDPYEQDQVVTLEQTQDGGKSDAGLTIADRPATPIDFARLTKIEAAPDGAAQIAKLKAAGAFGASRAFLGKDEDKDSLLDLKDAQGHTRLALRVAADGTASIAFLDATGKLVKTITP
jgi:hypothetical protein